MILSKSGETKVRVVNMKDLTDFQREVHQNAIEHGWYDNPVEAAQTRRKRILMNTDRFKFRIWDSAAKRYLKPYEAIFLGIDGGLYSYVSRNGWRKADRYERYVVEQCTGLKDKNGKLIFEGDICEDSLGNRLTVTWDSDNGRFLGFTIPQKMIIYVGREPRVEVIGNIHETTSE